MLTLCRLPFSRPRKYPPIRPISVIGLARFPVPWSGLFDFWITLTFSQVIFPFQRLT